jgi:hypothetical protein
MYPYPLSKKEGVGVRCKQIILLFSLTKFPHAEKIT